jgi:F-type H+-transporting ATPase subunit a
MPMMSNPASFAVSLCIGAAFGVAFFAGLWWTVRRALGSQMPALWLIVSQALRIGLLLLGLYVVRRGAPGILDGAHGHDIDGHARLGTAYLGCEIETVNLSSDQVIFWHRGMVNLNRTIVTTWIVMLTMTFAARLATRRIRAGLGSSRWQTALEIIVTAIVTQLSEVGLTRARRYLPFLGTLFLFVAICSLGTIVPGFEPPTGSLSTTAALAGCVLIAVPFFGITEQGVRGYLKTYTEPTLMMLPFNIISELSRTLALAVRLFGNMMSGTMIIAILLSITPFLFPVVMTALGLLTGMVQAYIFCILSAVYIAAATHSRHNETPHG